MDQTSFQISNPSFHLSTEQSCQGVQHYESTISVTVSPMQLTIKTSGPTQLSDGLIFSLVKLATQIGREK